MKAKGAVQGETAVDPQLFHLKSIGMCEVVGVTKLMSVDKSIVAKRTVRTERRIPLVQPYHV
jgi:hypothetical protein